MGTTQAGRSGTGKLAPGSGKDRSIVGAETGGGMGQRASRVEGCGSGAAGGESRDGSGGVEGQNHQRDETNWIGGAEADALERYEFYPQPRTISEAEPQLFMFREKEPRRLAKGKWERSYTLADGSVQNAVSDTADFSTWEEQAHGIATPEIPEALRANPAYAPKAE
jgi:hypothetical protein